MGQKKEGVFDVFLPRFSHQPVFFHTLAYQDKGQRLIFQQFRCVQRQSGGLYGNGIVPVVRQCFSVFQIVRYCFVRSVPGKALQLPEQDAPVGFVVPSFLPGNGNGRAQRVQLLSLRGGRRLPPSLRRGAAS